MKSKHETSGIDKPESIGVLSNDKEGTVDVDPQDEIVLSVSQDVIDRQAQSQGRRLDAAALQAFKDRCESTSGLMGSNAYVDCVDGSVNGASISCATACGVYCCIGDDACNKFTGKGNIHSLLF